MKAPRIARLLVLPLLIACLAGAWGCSTHPLGSMAAPVTSVSNPTFINGQQAPSSEGLIGSLLGGLLRLVTRVVDGLVGGAVSNGNWQVVVPPGAYNGSGTVGISVPSSQPAMCDLSISPSSLNHFAVPVQLSYKLGSLDALANSAIVWWDPDARVWREVASTVDSTTLTRTAALSHFSTYGCVSRAGW
jgi:hypothetical protein